MSEFQELALKSLKKSDIAPGCRDFIAQELERLWAMNTGKVGVVEIPDNRGAEPIDITNEYHHPEYETITCPHCGLTLDYYVVMPHRYCYMCGGKFGEKKLTCENEEKQDEEE